jgi:hypothetical protein
MNRWETFYIQTYRQQGLLIEEQLTRDFNPLFMITQVTAQHDADVT